MDVALQIKRKIVPDIKGKKLASIHAFERGLS